MKDTVKGIKRLATHWGKKLQNTYQITDLYPKCTKKAKPLELKYEKTNDPTEKQTKDMNRNLFKKDRYMEISICF